MSGKVFPLKDNQAHAVVPERSVWLSASAGTGKTQVLSARVLRLLLRPATRRGPPDFVKIPLHLRDPNALAVLATIVCITPGTVWAELSLDRSVLMLHVLEIENAQAIVEHVKTRYERPLMEIFE